MTEQDTITASTLAIAEQNDRFRTTWGADFTVWINHFKNQIYRNWNVPQSVLLGYRGHVDFEFTLERDGSMSALRMLKSSGTSSLDRAARNSLTASTFMNQGPSFSFEARPVSGLRGNTCGAMWTCTL